MNSTLLLTGIGLRPPHYSAFREKRPEIAWVEVQSEQYFGDGGQSLKTLESIRRDYPISMHGTGLSLGSTDDLNWSYLRKLRDLSKQINPCLISDHLAWSSINGRYLHDLMPLPYTEEALTHVVTRVQQVQDYLSRQLLIENIASYVQMTQSTMSEQEFLSAVAKQSGCGILLDINNIYVTATNLSLDAKKYIASIPTDLVHEFHLAGFSTTIINGNSVLVDSHNCAIAKPVWDLFEYSIQKLGRKPTIVEWDIELPEFNTLYFEAVKAEKIMREVYVATKRTA